MEEGATRTESLTHLHEERITSLEAKLEDMENRTRRQNLRLFGIPEGSEGADPRAYVVKLFQKAFLDLSDWDWDSQLQRVHRLPLV